MKFTQVAADAFQKLQLNAGVMLTEFDPSAGAMDRTKIFAATGGGVTITAVPSFIDFGDGIDNVPANTKELKRVDQYEIKISGTAKTMDTDFARAVLAAADVTPSTGKVAPRSDLLPTDFKDIWWVGDYSDVNADSGSGQNAAAAGFLAARLVNALSDGGLSIVSNDKSKGDFAFSFTAHYSLEDVSAVPFEMYVSPGTAAA